MTVIVNVSTPDNKGAKVTTGDGTVNMGPGETRQFCATDSGGVTVEEAEAEVNAAPGDGGGDDDSGGGGHGLPGTPTPPGSGG